MHAHIEGCSVLDHGLAQKFGPARTISALPPQDDIRRAHCRRGGNRPASYDLVVAASERPQNDTTSLAGQYFEATAEFTPQPDAQVPGAAMREAD
jgi:indolepyruvate ferredoxin oxidoreductase